MDEIKFRVWDKIFKGWFLKDATIWDLFKIMQNGILFSGIDWEKLKDRFVFQQYSGLRDKNGKEIYEGDIVKYCAKYYEDLYIVKFDTEGDEADSWPEQKIEHIVNFSGFYLEPINPRLSYITYMDLCSLIDEDTEVRGEVIGNIFENKELLEVTE